MMNKAITTLLWVVSIILYGYYFYGWYKIFELYHDPIVRKAEFLKLWQANSMSVVNILIVIPSVASILLLLAGYSRTKGWGRVLWTVLLCIQFLLLLAFLSQFI